MTMTPLARRTLGTTSLAALLLLAFAAIAAAHETWLLPSSARVAVGETVTLDLTSGMAFDTAEFAIEPARIMRKTARLAHRSTPLTVVRREDHALALRWTPRSAGIAALAVMLAPKRLELDSSKIEEYFAEIRATASIRSEWATMPAGRRWREEYVKNATTFVRVGAPSPSDSSWRAPSGLALEIVPLGDPTALRVGDTLAVRVLLHGKPLAGFMVGATVAGAVHETTGEIGVEQFVQTGADGQARIALPAAGRWLLHGTDLRRARGNPRLEWRSNFTTLTIVVAPPAS